VSTLDGLAVAAGESVDPARWQVLFDELMGRIAGRFARVEPRRRVRQFVTGLLAAPPGGADPGRGSGLRGLADRVEALDGQLQVLTAPGGGTCVRAEIPVDQKPARD
jgi:hypothetical protein